MEVATPPLSMSSIVLYTDQLAIGALARLIFLNPSSQLGGEMWWWTSIRCGFVCAVACGAKPAAAPSPSAATPPATNWRRLTAAAASGSAQHMQRAKSLRRIADVMAVLPLSLVSAAGWPSLVAA